MRIKIKGKELRSRIVWDGKGGILGRGPMNRNEGSLFQNLWKCFRFRGKVDIFELYVTLSDLTAYQHWSENG